MKKQLFFTSEEKGFFLPFVLFIASLIFIIFTGGANIYNQDIRLTHHYTEQIKIETLIQMARTAIKREIADLEWDFLNIVEYNFPDGHVTISYISQSETHYSFYFTVTTNNDTVFSIINYIHI